jgi:uncharacterized membrane protein YgcG
MDLQECSNFVEGVSQAAVGLLTGPTAAAAAAAAKAAAAAVQAETDPSAPGLAYVDEFSEATGTVTAASAHTATCDVLPALVIMGCCFLHWAQHSQHAAAGGSVLSFNDCALAKNIEFWCVLMQQWLLTSGTVAELTAAGYEPQAALQELEQLPQLLEAVQAVRAARPHSSSSSSGLNSSGLNSSTGDHNGGGSSTGSEDEGEEAAHNAAVVQQLRSAGLALCAFAVPSVYATTLTVSTCLGPQSWAWCQGAAACVGAAVLRATAAGPVRGHTGSSTSRCAQHWLQLPPLLHDMQISACIGVVSCAAAQWHNFWGFTLFFNNRCCICDKKPRGTLYLTVRCTAWHAAVDASIAVMPVVLQLLYKTNSTLFSYIGCADGCQTAACGAVLTTAVRLMMPHR